jgi:hypothetical protein
MPKTPYSGPWARIRKQILERDNHTCQIRGENCTTTANQVDHIIPIVAGGAWYDPHNLRASCATCNNKRSDNRHREKWRTAKTRIALIQGPPCAGKTTFVNENKGARDLVIDYDAIQEALGFQGGHNGDHLHGATMTARNALLRALRQGKLDVARAWIISANPRAAEMFPHHKLITINPGKETCYARAKEQGRPRTTFRYIDEWFKTQGFESAGDKDTSRTW